MMLREFIEDTGFSISALLRRSFPDVASPSRAARRLAGLAGRARGYRRRRVE